MERHGQKFAERLRIDVAKGTPSPLFRLLCAAMLFSPRINSGTAAGAARTLRAAGGEARTGSPNPLGAALQGHRRGRRRHFFCEVQVGWTELAPFADRRVLDAAGRLGSPKAAGTLGVIGFHPRRPRRFPSAKRWTRT